jgi:MFS family permease
MWFVAGIWVFVWGRFMSKTQIGISDAITFTLGFLVELPSGVFADIIGRKKTILMGNILLVIGNFGVAFGSSFVSITVWYLIWTIGYAFQSGATEALAYDSVKNSGNEDKWGSVIGTSTVIMRTTSMITNAMGGLFFAIWFRLPYIVFAMTGIIGIIAAYRLIEIPVKKTENPWSLALYLRQIKIGLGVLGKPIVFPIALISLWVAGMSYVYNWGFLRPLTGERFGYTAVTLPLLLFAISLAVIISTILLVRLKHLFDLKKWIYLFAGIYIVFFTIMGFNFSWLTGGLIMMSIAISASLIDQLFSQFINIHTKSENRATTLSATALLIRLPYVLLALLLGVLAERNLLPQFIFSAGIVAIFVWIYSIQKYKKTSAE